MYIKSQNFIPLWPVVSKSSENYSNKIHVIWDKNVGI